MVHRQRGNGDFAALLELAGDPQTDLFKIGEQIAVREHRAFGRAGRAAGVLQEGDVLMRQGDRFESRSCATLKRVAQGKCMVDVPAWHHFLDVLDGKIDGPALWRRQHVADLAADDVFDGGFWQHLLQGARKVLENDYGFGAGVLEQHFKLAGCIKRVDVNYDQAGAQNAEQYHRVLQQVGQHDADPITLRHVRQALQVGRKIARQAIEFIEADALAEVMEGWLVAEFADDVVDQFGDR